jgi:hypothetical protein
MGMLAALSGILYSSRLQSATTIAGQLFEMDAIAAAYVGGVSAGGGVGRVTGSIIGALVMMSLTNGMNLMGIDISSQYIVKGVVLVLAVVFDVATRNRGKCKKSSMHSTFLFSLKFPLVFLLYFYDVSSNRHNRCVMSRIRFFTRSFTEINQKNTRN